MGVDAAQIDMLGPVRLEVGQVVVRVEGARLRTLLVRLAMEAGRPVSTDRLIDAVWPHGGVSDPRHALQSLVSRLRRAVAPLAIRATPGAYALDVDPATTDVRRFETLVEHGRQELVSGQQVRGVARLREALGLWRGAPLVEVADTADGAAMVARLEELRLVALEHVLGADIDTSPGGVAATLHAAILAHPLREPLRVLQVRALHADGRPAEALRAFAAYRDLLAEELGAEPGPELQRAHLAVLRDDRGAASAQTARRGNLPETWTTFVGREAEQAELRGRLDEARLVTLVGPGGAGKSRLATTVAGDVEAVAWLVELAPVTRVADVAPAVVAALGLRVGPAPATGRRDPVDQLADALAGSDSLLVLDNCEHLLDAAASVVATLLARCPRVTFLATSREALGVTGEVVWPVPPLPLPTPDGRAEDSPAVQLFASRAADASPSFELTTESVATVAQICTRLDGLPLAIELAAARLRTMTLDQLAARLDDRFRVLTTGDRAGSARHRTLDAVMAWSWELLTDDERRAAERLAVFPSTFTTDAAGHLDVPVELLDALVDKSLLHVGATGPRYGMLETVREYAGGQLRRRGDVGAARTAHAAYYCDLATRAEPELRGFGQLPWHRRLAAERDNLHAALAFAQEVGDADTAVRLGAALAQFWTTHGEHAEATRRLGSVLSMPGPAPTEVQVRVAAGYLFNATLSGSLAETAAHAGRLAALADEIGLDTPVSRLIRALLALADHDPDRGLALFEGVPEPADAWERAMLWLVRSFLLGGDGAMDAMRDALATAAGHFRQAGERWGLSVSLTHLAMAHSAFGDVEAAVSTLEETLGVVRELGMGHNQRVLLAMIRIHAGDIATARAELADVVATSEVASDILLARVALADLARSEGDLAQARHLLQLVATERGHDDLGDHANHGPAWVPAMYGLAAGQLAAAEGDIDEAVRHLQRAMDTAVAMPDMPMVAAVVVAVAGLALLGGDPTGAAELLGAAHALRGAPDASHPDVAPLRRELVAELGESEVATSYDRGRGMSRDDTLTIVSAQLAASRSANTSRQPSQQKA